RTALPDLRGTIELMVSQFRAMPPGLRIFLLYAFFILGGIGLSLRYVVDTAIETPVSLQGLVVRILLAFTIFTTTLVLQRKNAARTLTLILASLTVPAVLLLLLAQLCPAALFVLILAILLFVGLTRPEVREY